MKDEDSDLTDLRCGAGWASLPKDDPMYYNCATHDLDYIQGGSKEAKKAADDNFKRNCEFTAEQKGTLRCWLEARILPPIASFFGRFFWQKESRMDEFLEEGKENESKQVFK